MCFCLKSSVKHRNLMCLHNTPSAYRLLMATRRVRSRLSTEGLKLQPICLYVQRLADPLCSKTAGNTLSTALVNCTGVPAAVCSHEEAPCANHRAPMRTTPNSEESYVHLATLSNYAHPLLQTRRIQRGRSRVHHPHQFADPPTERLYAPHPRPCV